MTARQSVREEKVKQGGELFLPNTEVFEKRSAI